MTLINRRTTTRYSVSLKGNLITQTGYSCPVNILNISKSGLSFIFKTEFLPFVVSTKINENKLSPVSIELEIDLTGNNLKLKVSKQCNQKIKIQCGIVYVQRSSFESSTVGCRFESFIDNADVSLEDYLLNLNLDYTQKQLNLDK